MKRPILSENVTTLTALLADLKTLEPVVERAADLVATTLKSGAKLLVCGNGGSAADAMHFATEFVVKFDQERRPYPAICLNVSGGDLTAAGNDYGYDESFARQVRAYGKREDVLVVFTTSGKSKNIVLALEAAAKIGMKSIAFLGKGGGETRGKASIELIVPTTTVTARVQEMHQVLLHTICEIVETQLPKD